MAGATIFRNCSEVVMACRSRMLQPMRNASQLASQDMEGWLMIQVLTWGGTTHEAMMPHQVPLTQVEVW